HEARQEGGRGKTPVRPAHSHRRCPGRERCSRNSGPRGFVPAMTWEKVATFLRPRLWYGWVACVVLWICWFISMGMGDWLFDRFHQLYAMDHLAFYTGGCAIKEGGEGDLYAHAKTSQFQGPLFGLREDGSPRWSGLEAFRNPPFYALPYTFTSRLSYS